MPVAALLIVYVVRVAEYDVLWDRTYKCSAGTLPIGLVWLARRKLWNTLCCTRAQVLA
jgi:hypothetical protein